MNKFENKPVLNRIHLQYLDGLRGLAALYVVLVHIEPEIGLKLPLFWFWFQKILRYGAFAVVIFIVLSGYVLMLPVSRSHDGHINGSIGDYLKRRSRRILPPYYAALALSLLVSLGVFILERFTSFQWNEIAGKGAFSPKFSLIDVISHLLLLHNLSPETLMTINSPMWSVATEWQIYFIFPLLLLPLWRRFGLLAVTVVSFIIGLLPVYLLNGFLESASPWFLGIFALGMVASEIGFSQKSQLVAMRDHFPWAILSILFTLIAFITEWRTLGLHIWIGQSFLGLAGGCLFIYCTKFVMDTKKISWFLNLFEHPLAVILGKISYSLYLTHGVVQVLIRYCLFNFQLSAGLFATASYILGTIASLAFAYVFYIYFERPFISAFGKNYHKISST
ncbi:acyltransferase family protein [Calothrix sp. PCC 6303]|uniref:acyltransferase family protein n=1 Tax=Calothrix sp. PCC 6303 TaxID=1170562 RepID=UPI0002A0411F|nr:acyltransferase [Calothrix sp. PCC 6303]AFY99679.1 acyltransferase 3 [Calothrix sp. PCC 6303]